MDKENLLQKVKEESKNQEIKNIIDVLGDMSLSDEDLLKSLEEKKFISFKPVVDYDQEDK